MWRLAPRLGLVDLPDPRKVHTVPVPRVGGWGITIGTLLPLLLWLKLDPLLLSLIIGILILFAFGIWDDRRNIGHWSKFSGQFLAAAVVVYYGNLYVTRLPFLDGDVLSPVVGRPLTMFALVGVINAMNHSDGLDGLAAGESLLTLIGLAILGYLASSTMMISVTLAIMGGILGFLRYNSHPARVFMGDAGSQVLGFSLGFLTIYLTQRVNTALSAAIPLLLLGVPLTDILVVLYLRAKSNNNWFKATRNHAHHRLLDLGFSHFHTVIIIYSVHATLVVSAVLLRYESDFRVAVVYTMIIGALYGGLMLLEQRGWRLHPVAAPEHSAVLGSVWNREAGQLVRGASHWLISLPTATFMLLGSAWAARVPRDIGVISAVLAASLGSELIFARVVHVQVVRITVYVASIASAYLIVTYPGTPAQHAIGMLALGMIAGLVGAVGAYIRFASEGKFGTTPTDYLIVFTLLALMVFAGIDAGSRTLVQIVVYVVVLLYSCEILVGHGGRRWSSFRVSALTALVVMAVRGLI
jgi:UDP-GlcNAc:undecaprenyl-phosphate GlcNAc-1-phosphate transferase